MAVRFALIALALALALPAGGAGAAAPDAAQAPAGAARPTSVAAGAVGSSHWPDALAGTIAHVRHTGVVRLGYRENAVPFSYLAAGTQPVGYSLELCSAIVDDLAEDLGRPLRIEHVRVTAADRLERVARGEVDLECGSTTSTAERRRQVAFSPVIFVTGTRLAVQRGSSVRSFRDLRGRPVGVVRGTTNEAAMRELDRLNSLGMRLVAAGGYGEALDLLASAGVDAVAADEVLLVGVATETGRRAQFRLAGEMLSFEPYGIAYAIDDLALDAAVQRTFRRLAQSGEIVWIYNRWFMRRLPSGQRLELPMSAQLRRAFELLGLPPE